MVYVSTGKLCNMPAQVSYVICQHRLVMLYASTGQFCCMSDVSKIPEQKMVHIKSEDRFQNLYIIDYNYKCILI